MKLVLQRVAIVAWLLIGATELAVGLSFHGSPKADPITGRTFAVQMHGPLYVQPWQGRLFYGLLWLQIIPFGLLVAVSRKPAKSRLFPDNPTKHSN
jgi:hypothetical protein